MSDSKYHYNKTFFSTPVPCGPIVLYQLGELFGNENTFISEHRQFCEEITFVVSGKGTVTEDGIKYPISAGKCFFSGNNELHSMTSDKNDPLHFYFIGFTTSDTELTAALNDIKEHRSAFMFSDSEKYIKHLIEESWSPSIYCNAMIGTYIAQFIISAARVCAKSVPALPGGSDASIVYRITAYIQTHVCEIDALSNIERNFNYSYGTLSREFMRAMGETLHSYFHRCRMEKASDMLKNGASVTEVAEELGYTSIHPFSRAYKNFYGFPPGKSKS